MRRSILLGLALALILSGCGRPKSVRSLAETHPSFKEVYAIKEAHPDSALLLLADIADTLDEEALHQRSAFQYYEYQVLVAELCYKNFIPIMNDSLVEDAAWFYDSVMQHSRNAQRDKILGFQFARAAYYDAAVMTAEGDIVGSFHGYLRALSLMDGITGKRRAFYPFGHNNDYEHFTALIYDRLAAVLYSYDAWDVAIEALERSNESFEKERNSKGIAQNLELMGDIMVAQGNHADGLTYYKEADSIHESLHTDNVYQQYSSLIHKSLDLYSDGERDSAYALLRDALNMTESPYLARKVHYTLGYFYYEDQLLDSAMLHYELSYPLLPRQTMKSYSRIVQIANQLGNTAKAAYYGDLLADFNLGKMAMGDDKTKCIAMFEEYKTDSHDLRHLDTVFLILCFVGLLAALIVVLGVWLRRRKVMHDFDKKKHARVKASLEERIRSGMDESLRKEEKIKALELELAKRISNPDFQQLPFDAKLETLMEMPICKRVLQVKQANVKAGVSYPELQLSDRQIDKLVNAVDAVFPKFSTRLIDQYPRLNRADVEYGCMYLLGVTEVEAAALTGKTYQAVWKRSLKMHEIFENKSDLQLLLKDIVKDW